MATVIPAQGAPRELMPRTADGFSLRELQEIVGGYIELLYAPGGRLMFINEDGKRLRLPFNHTATVLMRERLQVGDVIVGDVICLAPHETGNVGSDEEDPNEILR